jgi:ribosomal protein S18 acetylase RimI-like enzyme
MDQIRKADIRDLDQLAKLFNAYRVFYGKESALTQATAFLRERIITRDSEIFVSGADNVNGFVQLYPLFSSVRMKKLWLLNDLFVDPNHRGKGISLALIDEAKELCKRTNACGMYLETAKSNDIGNQLYPRAGFTLNDAHNFYDWDI